MVSFLHTSSTTTWSPFSHWRRHNINSKKPRAISYAYHILPHLKCTIKILTYYFINSKRKNGRGKPLSYKRQLNLGLGSGYRRREHAVVAVLASCKAMLGRRDGEQKLSISKRRRTLYGRAEIGNKNQKIQLKKSAKLFNLIKKQKTPTKRCLLIIIIF